VNVMEIEVAGRYAWPALEEQELSFGVLRFSRGTDRRSNSLSIYPHAEFEIGKLIDATEQFFAERDAASIVRLVQPDGVALDSIAELDSALELRGYEKQAPSLTMLLDLAGAVETKANSENGSVENLDAALWLQAWYALTNRDMGKIDVHKTLFEKSDLPHRFLLRQGLDGAPMSSGTAVYANQAMGLFGISIAIAQREKGHALDIVNSLLYWGSVQGAKFAYLQVEEANTAAVNLYQKLGFKKSYIYWYRVGEHTTSNSGD
jgi:RimJ/RimL family protein N-acetyltransferase